MDLINSLAGLLVGLLVGMTGVGGGSLMAPILILVVGVAPTTAVGTDLWFAAVTKMFGGLVHHRQGGVDTQVLRRLCWGSLPAAIATLAYLWWTGGTQIHNSLILKALGVVLVLTAFATFFRHRLRLVGKHMTDDHRAFQRWQPPLTVLAGVVLGVLVTLTSIGAGAMAAAMLVFLYPRRMTPGRIAGTDIVHAIPLTIVGGLGHLGMGNVDFGLLGSLLLGSIPGILIGSLLASRAPDGALRAILAAVLLAVGLKMML